VKEIKRFNGWGALIIKAFVPPIRYFGKALSERLLPSFNNLGAEAESKYKQLIQQGWDAEYASLEANDEYVFLWDVRQSVINLYAVGLRHLFEQQFCYLVSRLLNENRRKAEYNIDKKVIIDAGEINIEEFRSWKKIEELRYVCNVVKHAEGSSAENLEKVRPNLFKNPLFSGLPDLSFSKKRLPVRQPLAGENIFLQETDIETYALAIEDFWNEFIEKLEGYAID
jgi:hypothetical protein